jgi:hypothetical protein
MCMRFVFPAVPPFGQSTPADQVSIAIHDRGPNSPLQGRTQAVGRADRHAALDLAGELGVGPQTLGTGRPGTMGPSQAVAAGRHAQDAAARLGAGRKGVLADVDAHAARPDQRRLPVASLAARPATAKKPPSTRGPLVQCRHHGRMPPTTRRPGVAAVDRLRRAGQRRRAVLGEARNAAPARLRKLNTARRYASSIVTRNALVRVKIFSQSGRERLRDRRRRGGDSRRGVLIAEVVRERPAVNAARAAAMDLSYLGRGTLGVMCGRGAAVQDEVHGRLSPSDPSGRGPVRGGRPVPRSRRPRGRPRRACRTRGSPPAASRGSSRPSRLTRLTRLV